MSLDKMFGRVALVALFVVVFVAGVYPPAKTAEASPGQPASAVFTRVLATTAASQSLNNFGVSKGRCDGWAFTNDSLVDTYWLNANKGHRGMNGDAVVGADNMIRLLPGETKTYFDQNFTKIDYISDGASGDDLYLEAQCH